MLAAAFVLSRIILLKQDVQIGLLLLVPGAPHPVVCSNRDEFLNSLGPFCYRAKGLAVIVLVIVPSDSRKLSLRAWVGELLRVFS